MIKKIKGFDIYNHEKSSRILKNLYSPLVSKGAKFLLTKRKAAELIKYASNAFLATKITFINEIANLCEKVGIDVEDISIGVGLDKRIGSRFLRAGPAYGGSCFPKDTKAIVSTADKFRTNLSVIKSVIKSNKSRSDLLSKRLSLILKNKIKNKKISFLGVTFKANTDDVRESSSIDLIKFILNQGGFVNAYDPIANENMAKFFNNVHYYENVYDAINDVDAFVIMTEWNEFRSLDLSRIKKSMRNNYVLDTRNIVKMKDLSDLEFVYDNIGRLKI